MRILGIGLAALFLAAFSVAHAADEAFPPLRQAKGGKVKVAFTTPELTNESCLRNYTQIQVECEKRGWTLIKDTNVSYDGDKARNAFQRLLSQDPDAVVLAYQDIPPIADLIVEARRKGVGVYMVAGDLAPGVTLNVESAPAVIAAKITSYAIQRMNGVGDVSAFLDAWIPRGFRRDIVAAVLFEQGRWDFGPTEHHKLTPEGYTDELFRVTQNWITKYGKRLNFVWTHWDLGSITAARAMVEAGYTEKDMFTVGIDGGSYPWAVIREGKIPFVASLADPFEYMIHTIMECIDQAHAKGVQPGATGSLIPVTRYITVDSFTRIIDKTNVPAVGTNIHAVFDYYGGRPDDKDAWYNWGTPYTVKEGKE